MARKLIDVSGQVFGRLTVVKFGGNYIKPNGTKGTAYWVCRCECGKIKDVSGFDLRNGKVLSCGCFNRDKSITHGKSKTKTYNIWHGILMRCNNPNDTTYKYYGARGIKVCKRWYKFENFLKDMGECPSPDHTIDRVNVDRDYKPSNCKWATRSEQMRNRRPYDNWNQKIPHSEVKKIRKSKKTSKELAEHYGVNYKHICAIRSGTARPAR